MVRKGTTLLEVILALVILAGAMATLGELLRIAGRHATAAQELTKAQMYCQAVMDQLDAGLLTMSPVTDAPLELNAEWTYSIQSQPLQMEGLMSVQVTVQRNPDDEQRALGVTLTRWMLDPEYLEQRVAEEEAIAAAAAEAGE